MTRKLFLYIIINILVVVRITGSVSIFDAYLQFYVIIGKTTQHAESAFPESAQVLCIYCKSVYEKPNGYTDDLFHYQKLLKYLQQEM